MKGLSALVSVVHKVKKCVPSLDVYLYGKKDIRYLLEIIAKYKKDNTLLQKYKNGELRCNHCKKIIGPNNEVLGGVIQSTNRRIKFVCQDFECYEKAIK